METNSFTGGMSASRPSRLSFREAFRIAAKQTEMECCGGEANEFRELCYIIAEVYLFDDQAMLRMGDEEIAGYVVKEVFGELRHEHLQMVLMSFRRVPERIQNKRAYLRRMLYNVVFEYEARITNDLAVVRNKGGSQ